MATSTTNKKKTVLITGCSDGGIGSALALEFHRRGLAVFATARSVAKMSTLASVEGICCFELEVTSAESIAAAVARVGKETSAASGPSVSAEGDNNETLAGDGKGGGSGSLDFLINNAGVYTARPFMHTDVADLQRVMDVNVVSVMAVTQAFLPLLMARGGGLVANIGSNFPIMSPPWSCAYAASKAALHAFGNAIRVELEPLGVKVVTVVSGAVGTNLFENGRVADPQTARDQEGGEPFLPEGSPYKPCEEFIRDHKFFEGVKFTPVDEYARKVVGDLLKPAPKRTLWRGSMATLSWFMWVFGWEGMLESIHIKGNKLDQCKP